MGSNRDEWSDGDSKKLTESWNSHIDAIDAVDFYGDDDFHDILPRVFPNQKAASSGSKPM